MGKVCVHGSLARACDRCEDATLIAALEAELQEMTRRRVVEYERAETAESALAAAREEIERLSRAYEAHGGSWKYCATGHCDKQICPDGPSYICICRDYADGSCDLAEYWRQQNEHAQHELAALRARADDAERVESVACDVWSQIGPGLSTGWSWAQLVGTYPEIANGFREKIRAVLAAADGTARAGKE